MKRNKIKSIIILFYIFLFFSLRVYALEAKFEFTKEFEEWMKIDEENRMNIVVPDSTDAIITDDNTDSEAWSEKNNMIFSNIPELKSLLTLPNKFSLSDEIEIDVENQEGTEECWAFSTLTSMETNLLYNKNIKNDFSERHMDYATSNSFYYTDKIPAKYKRLVSYGGKIETALAYLTNGQGAVLERKMPFENNMNEIYVEDIDIKPSYYVTDYERFPSILKEFDSKGNIKYYNSYGKELSMNDVLEIRTQIKEHIVNYGSIVSVTSASYKKGYNNKYKFKSTNYFCNDSSQVKDHSIAIVGWDDNYKKENFNEKNRPKSDGAYIALQTYSDKAFANGYIYISYEDIFVESNLVGICNSEKYNYDNLYQNDFYGANCVLSIDNCQTCYYGTYFNRKNENEVLKQVSIAIPEKVNIEVYINPKGSEMDKDKLIKASNTINLSAGYHTINIDPINLTGESFAIVIKQVSNNNKSYINIESKIDNVFYDYVNSENKSNFVSVDGYKWSNLTDIIKDKENNDIIETSDFCIKGYTIENIK